MVQIKADKGQRVTERYSELAEINGLYDQPDEFHCHLLSLKTLTIHTVYIPPIQLS